MKLYDPERPKIYHKLAFLPGQFPIPKLQIFPLENDLVEISMMLPLGDSRFSGKFFSLLVPTSDLPNLILSFKDNPETFIEENFSNDPSGLVPKLGLEIPSPNPSPRPNPKTQPQLSISDFLAEES